ncbi:MAG: anthranilate synthase component I family protein [Bacteroidales bacterium]
MERQYHTLSLENATEYASRFLRWAHKGFDRVAFLVSNSPHSDPYGKHHALLAIGSITHCTPDQHAFSCLKDFSDQHQDWIFGFLSYDLKNQLEDLTSNHPDGIGFPQMHFFVPRLLVQFFKDHIRLGLVPGDPLDPAQWLSEVLQASAEPFAQEKVTLRHRVSQKEYMEKVRQMQKHIQAGDIYEANYCIEFFAEDAVIQPVETFVSMNTSNPSPFACFFRYNDRFLISSSPERFLAKRGNKLISQPIKGTIRRGADAGEDEMLKQQLFLDPKERSENVMIVDLVRNDLSKTATKGSVKVEELFGIYTYPRVHQMISTVCSQLRSDLHFTDALREAFPMGSMTGAPKIRAMQIIEQCEATKRGLYSGAVGYIEPNKDFDFNVIIRSILYNHSEKFLSFMAGSAITIDALPEKEYKECLLKAASMAQAVHATL